MPSDLQFDWKRFVNLRTFDFTDSIFLEDVMLMRVVSACPWIGKMDISYAEWLTINGLSAIAPILQHLCSLRMEAVLEMEDQVLREFVWYHKHTLVELYLYGCYELTDAVMNCPSLRILSFHKMDGLNHALMHNLTTLITRINEGNEDALCAASQHCINLQLISITHSL